MTNAPLGDLRKLISGALDDAEISMGGYREELVLQPLRFFDASGAPLTALTTPTRELISGFEAIVWPFNAGAANHIRANFWIPGWFDATADKCEIDLLLRKRDATDENTDLAVDVLMASYLPARASKSIAASAIPSGNTLTAGASNWTSSTVRRTLAASGGTIAGVTRYTFDLNRTKPGGAAGGRTSAQKLYPYAQAYVQIAPSEQVGSADMFLELWGALVRFRRFPNLPQAETLATI